MRSTLDGQHCLHSRLMKSDGITLRCQACAPDRTERRESAAPKIHRVNNGSSKEKDFQGQEPLP